MALLLCIDTALETATVGLCNEEGIIDFRLHSGPKNSAAFVQPAIQSLLQDSRFSFNQIDAVAVVNGPGSYTGLRVGLASAKGICYAAQKPLILINTLEVMAKAAIEQQQNEAALYCPTIDARRDEVFTAVYNASLHIVLPPQALIVEKNSFEVLLESYNMYFFGSGHNKCEKILGYQQNALFIKALYSLSHINYIGQQLYEKGLFNDVAYAEPYYSKNFYSPGK
ncbi:MAG: tRNA (adenosine(37)-N6)-threonylcarbamoyltransferase complex dimerization subunit type 1 TsaB [Bacteroidota bacterium]|nr:tRNA (adenosine(37)-N6)-threonylcarbamoyltransferase complex dimerization subunit type 1 TsaB [Bacteroidota bacterium]